MLIDSFFDQQYEGEFSLLNFCISVAREYKFPDRHAFGPDQLLHEVMSATALFHEYKHYHDLVGTPCGLHLMLHVTRLVDRFLAYCQSEGRGTLFVPLRKSAPLSPLVVLFDGYQSFLRAMCGDLPWRPAHSGSNDDEESRVRVMGLDLKIPMVRLTDIDPLSGEDRDRFIPVGMRAIMEASALDTQFFLSAVGAGDPHSVDEEEMLARGDRVLKLTSKVIRGGFLIPYAVCSLLFHYTSRKFPPLGTLSALSDAALTYSGFSEAAFPGTAPTFDHPGLVFMNLLDAWATLPKTAEPSRLSLQLDEATKNMGCPGYESAIAEIANRAETNPDSLAPHALGPNEAKTIHISRIRSYLFRDFSRIAKQKAADPEKWFIAPEYLRQYEELPFPPLASVGKSAIRGVRPKSETVDWFVWLFLLAMIGDLIENHQLNCPIAARFPAQGELFVFDDPSHPGASTNCIPFIEKRCCGSYNGRFKEGQPTCPFTQHVTRILDSFSFNRIEFSPEIGENK
jgi:hypothetical protein